MEPTAQPPISSPQELKPVSSQLVSFKKRNWKFILVCVFFGLLGIYIMYIFIRAVTVDRMCCAIFSTKLSNSYPSISPTITPTSSISSQQNAKLEKGTIAFIKENDLYLLNQTGISRLTTNAYVSKFKWSKDGKFIGYISHEEIQPKGLQKQLIGSSLSILDPNSRTSEEILRSKLTTEATLEEIRKADITGFDFSRDNKKIIYVRNGIWLKDLTTNQEEKLLSNFEGAPPTNLNFRRHADLSWNSSQDKILLFGGSWECSFSEVYDLKTKQNKQINDGACVGNRFWSADGKQIITYSPTGLGDNGLWITDTTLETKKIIQVNDPSYTISVEHAFVTKNGQLFAIIEQSPRGEPLQNQRTLYKINSDGKKTVVKNYPKNTPYQRDIVLSPDEQTIIYVISESQNPYLYNLYSENFENNNNKNLLLTNITAFAWSPVINQE